MSWHTSSAHTFTYSFITVELGLVIGKRGRDISQANAESHVIGYSTWLSHNPNKRDVSALTAHTYLPSHASSYPCLVLVLLNSWCQALAVDMTARNLQDKVKKQGLPWTAAKGFDTFTPIGSVSSFSLSFNAIWRQWCTYRSMIPKTAVQDPHNLNLSLSVGLYIRIDLGVSFSLFVCLD